MKEEKAERRRNQIIEAAFRCIAEKGYENVTMNTISEYARLSKGAINYYFKTKEDILVAVLNQLDRKLYAVVDEKVRGTTKSEDHLRYRLSGSFELTREDPTLIYVLMDFLSLGVNRPEFKKIIKKFFSKYRYLSSVGVNPGLEAGLYRHVEPAKIGAVVVALIIGLGIQWVLDEDGLDFDGVTELAEDMVIKYLEGETGS